MLVWPNSFIFSNWMSLYSSRTALKSRWLGPSCMASTVTLLLIASAGLYVVRRLSSSISISSSHPRSTSSCWGLLLRGILSLRVPSLHPLFLVPSLVHQCVVPRLFLLPSQVLIGSIVLLYRRYCSASISPQGSILFGHLYRHVPIRPY